MTKKSNLRAALGVALVAVFALSGCSYFVEDELPTLARERVAADVLPAELVAPLTGDGDDAIDLDTVRLAGEHKGAQFYIAHARDDRKVCLIIYVTTEQWVGGCNAAVGTELSVWGNYSVRLTRDGVLPAEEKGWVVLTDDVLVRKTNFIIHEGPQS